MERGQGLPQSKPANVLGVGHAQETLRHRFWDCPANSSIDNRHVRNTQGLAAKGVADNDAASARRGSGILPRHLCGPKAPL